ncbi:hypothetical protein IHE43_06810 [Flavobacterium sp. MDT1-60]|nr:hypothetical protein IHE43_06810 [Flavobacterium sp. MDT1-60]
MTSGTSYACGKSSEKTSCEKKVTSTKSNSDSCQKDCCKKGSSSKKDQHGCNGKCDHSGCTTSGLQFSLISENEFTFNDNTFNFSLEKPILYYTETPVSDGFTSIWLPPKIK